MKLCTSWRSRLLWSRLLSSMHLYTSTFIFPLTITSLSVSNLSPKLSPQWCGAVGMVLTRWWAVPGSSRHDDWHSSQTVEPLFHQTREFYFLCHASFTELLSGSSTIQGWLLQCFRNGCLGRCSSLHKATLLKWPSGCWSPPHLRPFYPDCSDLPGRKRTGGHSAHWDRQFLVTGHKQIYSSIHLTFFCGLPGLLVLDLWWAPDLSLAQGQLE